MTELKWSEGEEIQLQMNDTVAPSQDLMICLCRVYILLPLPPSGQEKNQLLQV